MKGITCIFTQAFHYPTFQLLGVSALPLNHYTKTTSSMQTEACNLLQRRQRRLKPRPQLGNVHQKFGDA